MWAKVLSCSAPHMRAFHLSWAALFVAFLGWFALAPLMPVLKADLGLTRGQVSRLKYLYPRLKYVYAPRPASGQLITTVHRSVVFLI